jgi:NADH-quinone oxidoreductase subunit H
MAEAESELIAGYHTEYSGIKFALIQAAEFGGVMAASAVIATLFLSGWEGPLDQWLGWLWFILKTIAVASIFIWVRATFPRLRIDQLLTFAWKFLLPASLINLLATSLEVYFLRDAEGVLTRGDLGIMTGINLAIMMVCIFIFGNLVREKVTPVVAGRVPTLPPGVTIVEGD